MKKSLILFITLVFCVGSLYAAPAQRSTAGGGSSKRTQVNKAPTKSTATAAKTKTQERQEAQTIQLGLMPPALDSMNHSVFSADASAIRGAMDTESALRYIPFVTIINTAGFGQAFDLRGQGRLSANGVKLYINGVPSNPLDSYFNPMPINSVIPRLIYQVEVVPGSGAVQYGSGTKGGTINIVTSRRTDPFFLVGASYVNTMATQGHSYNAFAQAAENFGPHFGVNAGVAFSRMGGPREDDKSTSGEAVLGAAYDIGWGQVVSLDADVFYNKLSTTPYNSLLDEKEIMDVMHRIPFKTDNERSNELGRQQAIAALANFTPDKDDRATKGNGEIEKTQVRITGNLSWLNQVTQKLSFDVKGFYNFNMQKYNKYTLNLPYFVLGYVNPDNKSQKGYTWFLPRLTTQQNAEFEGQRTDWHFFDQSGTTFNDYKFGLKGKMDWKHDNGEFIFGLDGYYEISNRKSKTYLRQAIFDEPGSNTGGNSYALEVTVDDKTDLNVFTGAVYLLERYDFNRNFSLTAGARYELKAYDVKINDVFEGVKLKFPQNNQGAQFNTANPRVEASRDIQEVPGEYSKNYDNFTAELIPLFKYSNTGSVYARGEVGYVAPPAWAMLRRIGIINLNNPNSDSKLNFNFDFEDTQLKSETYYTAELGWQEAIGTRRIPAYLFNLDINAMFFSAKLFYTQSQNEFYFEGDTWSGMSYGNYDKSRRMGAEVALEQYIFGGALGFNESFTYIKAQKMGCPQTNPLTGECISGEEWQSIPYTYDYKATLGARLNVTGFLEIVDVSVNIWMQNSIYGKQTIYNKMLTPVTPNGIAGSTTFINYLVSDGEEEKLKPYLISDFGISVGINKDMGVVTVGIKNLFDTLYYDYFNNDRSAVVNENRYVIGRGRTVFVEGTFRY